jgi:hypothetical protein
MKDRPFAEVRPNDLAGSKAGISRRKQATRRVTYF